MLKTLKGMKTNRYTTIALMGILGLAAQTAQAQNYIYWTDTGNNAIGRLNLATPLLPEPTWLTGAIDNPAYITVDSQYLYWAQTNSNPNPPTIGIASLDGTTTFNTAFVTLTSPAWGIAVDDTYIYWTELSNSSIGRVLKADGVTDFNENWMSATSTSGFEYLLDQPFGLAIYSGELYWTDGADNTIEWVNTSTPTTMDGYLNVQTLDSGNADLWNLVVNASFIYWGDGNDDLNNPSLFPQIGQASNTPGSIGTSPNATWLQVQDPNSMYYAYPVGLTVTNMLFFTDSTNEEIWQTNLDGSSPTVLVSTPELEASPYNLSAFTPFGITATNAPLVITLDTFTATAGTNQVTLNWTTGSEFDNAGFNVLRSTSPNGGFVKANASLLPSLATFPGGASYTWTDSTATTGQTYFYELQDVDTNNVITDHGPISAHVGPTAIQAFTSTPATIFTGGTATLYWTATSGTALNLSTVGAVTGTSLQVHPAKTTSYQLTDTTGDLNLTTVNVRGFTTADLPGLSKAWGSKVGQAAYDPAFDVNGDGQIDDTDVALLLNN